MTGKLAFVFAGRRNVRAIEVCQFTRRKRHGRNCCHRARDPSEGLLFLRDFASGIGGGPGLSWKKKVAIFVRPGPPKMVANFFPLFLESPALPLPIPCFHLQPTPLRL